MVDPLPHDRDLERQLVGGLLSRYHHGTPPDPDDFYDPMLARAARAAIEHAERLLFREIASIERDEQPVYSHVFEGLAEVLEELGDPHPRRSAFLAGILASQAPVTHEGDVRRLHDLACARRRLVELDEERRQLLEATR